MSLALDDLPRDPDRLLLMLQQMAEVTAGERSRITSLEIERDTVLAERDAARTERDLIREKHDAAQAEVEKLRLLIRQLQRGQFGRRSEKLDPGQLQLGLEDLEQTVAAAEAAQEEVAARNSSTASSPWRGSPTCSSAGSREAPRRTSSTGFYPGLGRPSGSQLLSMSEHRDDQRMLALSSCGSRERAIITDHPGPTAAPVD